MSNEVFDEGIPDFLLESLSVPRTKEVPVLISYSLARDLSYIAQQFDRTVADISVGMTTFALGAHQAAEGPSGAIYRNVAGFEETVSLCLPELTKDPDWHTDEDNRLDTTHNMVIELEGEWADTLMNMANSLGIDIEELYRRVFRLNVYFVRDIEEYGGSYYIKKDGVKGDMGSVYHQIISANLP